MSHASITTEVPDPLMGLDSPFSSIKSSTELIYTRFTSDFDSDLEPFTDVMKAFETTLKKRTERNDIAFLRSLNHTSHVDHEKKRINYRFENKFVLFEIDVFQATYASKPTNGVCLRLKCNLKNSEHPQSTILYENFIDQLSTHSLFRGMFSLTSKWLRTPEVLAELRAMVLSVSAITHEDIEYLKKRDYKLGPKAGTNDGGKDTEIEHYTKMTSQQRIYIMEQLPRLVGDCMRIYLGRGDILNEEKLLSKLKIDCVDLPHKDSQDDRKLKDMLVVHNDFIVFHWEFSMDEYNKISISCHAGIRIRGGIDKAIALDHSNANCLVDYIPIDLNDRTSSSVYHATHDMIDDMQKYLRISYVLQRLIQLYPPPPTSDMQWTALLRLTNLLHEKVLGST